MPTGWVCIFYGPFFFSDSKEYDWSFADAVNDDIVNSKGDEQERAIEKRMSDVIGWMSFPLFLGIVFGGMAAGVLELIWPHDKLATGLKYKFIMEYVEK